MINVSCLTLPFLFYVIYTVDTCIFFFYVNRFRTGYDTRSIQTSCGHGLVSWVTCIIHYIIFFFFFKFFCWWLVFKRFPSRLTGVHVFFFYQCKYTIVTITLIIYTCQGWRDNFKKYIKWLIYRLNKQFVFLNILFISNFLENNFKSILFTFEIWF